MASAGTLVGLPRGGWSPRRAAAGGGGCDQAAPGPEGAERLAPAPRVGPARWAGSFGFPPTLRPALVVAAGCPSVDAD